MNKAINNAYENTCKAISEYPRFKEWMENRQWYETEYDCFCYDCPFRVDVEVPADNCCNYTTCLGTILQIYLFNK